MNSTEQTRSEMDVSREINLRILRGEITAEEVIKSGSLTRQSIKHFQEQYFISSESGPPWQEVLVKIWNTGTRGPLKYVVLPLFTVFIVVPAIASFYESGVKLYSAIAASLAPSSPVVSEMDASELDVCNEWVARVGLFDNRDDARREKEDLIQAMKDSNEWTWVDDVHIGRDPLTAKKYLLLVDMWSASSSREEVSEEIERIKNLEDPIAKNRISNKMLAAMPLYYRQSAFENTYGSFSRTAPQCQYKET